MSLQVNPELMARDREEWGRIFQQILQLLRHAADRCLELGSITQEQRDKFFVSGEDLHTMVQLFEKRWREAIQNKLEEHEEQNIDSWAGWKDPSWT